MRRSRALFAAGAVATLAIMLPMSASAASDPPPPQQWTDQLAAPFSLAADGHRVLIADGGTGVIGQLQPDGSVVPVIDGIPGLTGVATRGAWMAYGSTISEDPTQEESPILESGLNIRTPQGDTIYADLHAYEEQHNADGALRYGITDPESCVASDPRATYTGLIDAHVYNVTAYRGAWLVADAGANTVMKVTDEGEISTVAVLDPVPVEITGMIAGAMGLPPCAVGDTYYAEAVPTGIAIGPGGAIYVSTLPGFPGMITTAGAVWQIDPRSGDATQLASGLSQPTSLAVSGKSIYIAELEGAGVSVLKGGEVSPYAALPGALSVATATNGTVWAATMASDAGPGALYSMWKGKVKVQGHVIR
ncbi:ScyD/ScyE family protein [Microbacterium sp. Mu-80]|uniref:ScyD/ScyE family protein n=1 Tax=Microbacterium bandirmense TaxID=3122050 RepID=A0ABU8LAS4_9MICO